MSRLYSVIIAGLAGVIAANAGQIQIGGANGLTAAYFSNPTANGCAGTCITGSTTGWGESNYLTSLFSAATASGGTVIPNLGAGGSVATSFTDPNNGVQFNLINDTVNSTGGTGNKNVWVSNVVGADTLTIPVGVFDVSSAYLAINDIWGWSTDGSATVVFNFSATDPTTGSTPDSFSVGGSNGALRASLNCTNSACMPTTLTGGHFILSGAPYSAVTPLAGVTGDASVSASTLWNGTYSAATVRYAGTSGNLMLDDLGFDFGTTYANDYLVSIQIISNSDNANQMSRLALSGVTVSTGTGSDAPFNGDAPEPGTIASMLGGLGMIGAFVRRQRK